MTGGKGDSHHGVHGRRRQVSPSRCMTLSLPFRGSPPSDRPPNTAQFLRETGWVIFSKRFRLAGRHDRAGSLALLRCPGPALAPRPGPGLAHSTAYSTADLTPVACQW